MRGDRARATIVRLLRLARDNQKSAEGRVALEEANRLATAAGVHSTDVELAMEEADGPYHVDLGRPGRETEAVATCLASLYGDQIVARYMFDESATLRARGATRAAAAAAAARYKHFRGQLRLAVATLRLSQDEEPAFYLVTTSCVEGRVNGLRAQSEKWRPQAAPPRPAAGLLPAASPENLFQAARRELERAVEEEARGRAELQQLRAAGLAVSPAEDPPLEITPRTLDLGIRVGRNLPLGPLAVEWP